MNNTYVFIIPVSKVIDPCNENESMRLPNLELRYLNVNTTLLPKSINDSKLPFRWYNVGNNTMPEILNPNDINRCGTHLPIYSSQAGKSIFNHVCLTYLLK